MQLNNRKRFVLTLLSTILLSIPWIWLQYGWILLFAWVPIFLITSSQNRRKPLSFMEISGWAGLCFGGWNTLTTWWLGYSTMAGAFTLIGLNTLIFTLVFTLSHMTGRYLLIQPSILFIFFWTGFEYLYHHTYITWPWLTLGNGLANQVQLIQWYEYTGVFGGTLWILISNHLISNLINSWKQKKIRKIHVLPWMLFIVLPILFSCWSYQQYKETSHPIRIGILQPNIDPFTQKFKDLTAEQQVEIILDLLSKCAKDHPDLIVGPETALTGSISEVDFQNSSAGKRLFDFIQRNPHTDLILGAETSAKQSAKDRPGFPAQWDANTRSWTYYYNTAVWFDIEKRAQFYHKRILVAGVEKPALNPKLNMNTLLNYQMGGSGNSLDTSNHQYIFKSENNASRVAPVICYESVFGWELQKKINQNANILAIITNDGWFRDSPGPGQHLLLGRIRAIEYRRSIARSANTGISAFISQRGDILQSKNNGERGVLTGILNLNAYQTFYARYGDYAGYGSVYLSLVLLLWMILKRASKKTTFIQSTLEKPQNRINQRIH